MTPRFVQFISQHREWIAAGLLGVLCCGFVVAPLIVQASQEELGAYAAHASIPLYEDTVDGYRQIYTIFNDEKVFFSTESRNHTQGMAAGQYVVWVETVNGAGQIVRYDIPTRTEVRITDSSTNQHPRVNAAGLVVWERWLDDRWQLFYFDGISTIQLTDGDVSTDPELEGNQLLFNRQDSEGEWSAYAYDFDARALEPLLTGPDARHPVWEAGEIVFPLKVAREREEARLAQLAETASSTPEHPADSEAWQLFQRGALTEEQYLLRITPALAPTPPTEGPVMPVADVFSSTTALFATSTPPTEPVSESIPSVEPSLEPPQVREEDIRRELIETPVIIDTEDQNTTPVSTPDEAPLPPVSLPQEPVTLLQETAPAPEETTAPILPVVTEPEPPAPDVSQ